MNFLQIAQRLRQECGVPGTGPSTVQGQTGELKRLVDWAASAWEEIQNKHANWLWMRSEFSLETQSGQARYSGTDATDTRLEEDVERFARWIPLDDAGYNNIRIYEKSAGVGTERWLPYISWEAFRGMYGIGTQNPGSPMHCTIDPQNRLVLGPTPNGVYVVSGEYQMSAQMLAEDNDEPEMPARFHMLIVYRAMEKYGQYTAAVEVFNRGVRDGNMIEVQLEADQLPTLVLAEPMA